jgi:seryl-tRNA synthetase
MLELRFVRENLELVRKKCLLRGADPQLIDRFAETDNRRLTVLAETESLKNQRNTVSKSIAGLKQSGQHDQAEPMIAEMRAVSEQIKELDSDLAAIEEDLRNIVMSIPNLCDDSVPEGRDETDNPEIKRWGVHPIFPFHRWRTGRSVKNLGSLILRPLPVWPERGLPCSRALGPVSPGRWSVSFSISIPNAMAIPRCCRRSWSTPRP